MLNWDLAQVLAEILNIADDALWLKKGRPSDRYHLLFAAIVPGQVLIGNSLFSLCIQYLLESGLDVL